MVDRMETYKIITQKIIDELTEALETGSNPPWRGKWKVPPPRNFDSGRNYNGINFFLLYGRGSPYWITHASIEKHGATLKQGAQAEEVVLLKFFKRDVEVTRKGVKSIESRTIPFYRLYHVYNTNDVEGLPEKKGTTYQQATANELFEIILKINKPRIYHGGDQPCYVNALDSIFVPAPNYFESMEAYYGTLSHELVHWTGHATRLNREGVVHCNKKHREQYSKEELIAEMGSALVCAEAGISNDEMIQNSVAYLRSWIKVLNDNPTWVVQAASAAQRATDCLITGKYPKPKVKQEKKKKEEQPHVIPEMLYWHGGSYAGV